jgi:hypothetical protein
MATWEMQEAIRRGSYVDAEAMALPRTTHDSQRTLTNGHNPAIIPAAAAAAPPNHKTRGNHAENF